MASISPTSLVQEARRRGLIGMLALYVVSAWVVLQVAALAFPGWSIPDSAIRFIWIGAAALFPITLIFGWRYDITASGIRRTPPADSESDRAHFVRTDFFLLPLLFAVAGSICFVVVGEVLATRDAQQPAVAAKDIPHNSIAVLPFVNMSDDKSNEYFSDGITEQLLNELARVSDLHVAARTSAFYYKNKNERMQTMGQALGVRTLLEGSVRKVGNSVRITAQLINASDGYHLWSETYDRELDDIFAIQDEIAAAIVATLRIELLTSDQERLDRTVTSSVEAYDTYLRGMAYRLSNARDALDKSNEYFQQAIDFAPDFALAYDALAYGYLLKAYDGSMPVDDAAEEAEILLAKALELQPDLEEAHATLGLLKSRLARFAEANEHYETALAINPNYFGGQVNYGLSLVHQSRLKEASAAYLHAQALDPINANLNSNLGALLMLMGQFDQGYAFMQKSLLINPDQRSPKAAITHWLGTYGRLVEAVQFGRKTVAAHPDYVLNITALIRAYRYLGMHDVARELLLQTRQSMPDNEEIRSAESAFWLATGDFEAFGKFTEENFGKIDANPQDPINYTERGQIRDYSLSLLLQGKNQESFDLLYWAVGGQDGIASTSYDQMDVLKLLALAYRRLDRHEESDALLDQCIDLVNGAHDNGWATPTLYVRLAEVYALKNDLDKVAENLQTAFAKGWRDLDQLDHNIFWQHLQDDPGVNRVKLLLYNDREAQKSLLQESAANFESVMNSAGGETSRSTRPQLRLSRRY